MGFPIIFLAKYFAPDNDGGGVREKYYQKCTHVSLTTKWQEVYVADRLTTRALSGTVTPPRTYAAVKAPGGKGQFILHAGAQPLTPQHLLVTRDVHNIPTYQHTNIPLFFNTLLAYTLRTDFPSCSVSHTLSLTFSPVSARFRILRELLSCMASTNTSRSEDLIPASDKSWFTKHVYEGVRCHTQARTWAGGQYDNIYIYI